MIKLKTDGPKAQTRTRNHTIHPLRAWRSLTAEQLGDREAVLIRRLLANTALFGRAKWQDAVAGDVAAAAAVAVSFIPVDKFTIQLDLAMSALVLCAIDGDPAASIVLANMLRNLPGGRAGHRRIATSWFVSNLKAAAALRGGKPSTKSRKDRVLATAGGSGSHS